MSATEKLKNFIAKTGGTEIGAAKSLTDALGHTGLARLDSGLDGVLADGLINGAGTVLPAGASMYGELAGALFATGTDSLHALSTELDEILDLTRGYAEIACSAAETSLYIDDAPVRGKVGKSVKVGLENLAAGDTYVLREYYRKTSGGAYKKVSKDADNTYVGVQDPTEIIIKLEPYLYGCKISAQKTAGTDRTISYESFVEA